MKKTYKKIEEDRAREYNYKLNELNKTVDSLRNLGYSKKRIEEIRANLLADLQANQETKVIENIVDGYRKLGYLEEEIEKIKADLFANLQKKIKSDIEKDELYGKEDEILEEMGEKYVNIEDTEIEGYKGKKIKITFPEQRRFKGKTFEFFISDEIIGQEEFESNPELVNKSGSMKNTCDLLSTVREYMDARGVKGMDGGRDYEKDLGSGEDLHIFRLEALTCLNKIIKIKDSEARLNGRWLKDKGGITIEHVRKRFRYQFFCSEGYHYYFSRCFVNDKYNDSSHLFLRLSD